MPRGLNPQRERFVNAYLENGRNAAGAMRQAGYTGSEASIRQMASRLLTNVNVRSHIRARLDAEGVTPDRVIQRLGLIAFMSLDSPYLKKIEYDRFGAIKSESTDLTQVVKAASELAKILGMTRNEIDVNLNAPVRALIYTPPRGYELSATTDGSADRAGSEPEI